jgi:hypothetical protein
MSDVAIPIDPVFLEKPLPGLAKLRIILAPIDIVEDTLVVDHPRAG